MILPSASNPVYEKCRAPAFPRIPSTVRKMIIVGGMDGDKRESHLAITFSRPCAPVATNPLPSLTTTANAPPHASNAMQCREFWVSSYVRSVDLTHIPPPSLPLPATTLPIQIRLRQILQQRLRDRLDVLPVLLPLLHDLVHVDLVPPASPVAPAAAAPVVAVAVPVA